MGSDYFIASSTKVFRKPVDQSDAALPAAWWYLPLGLSIIPLLAPNDLATRLPRPLGLWCSTIFESRACLMLKSRSRRPELQASPDQHPVRAVHLDTPSFFFLPTKTEFLSEYPSGLPRLLTCAT